MAAYEESRKQRLEENKRRMEELGLMNLAEDLKQKQKPKAVRKKPEKRKIELHEARRSSRVAAKPVVVYRDQLQRAKGAREGKERRGLRRRYLTETARELAIEAAEELAKGIENPAFVKPMLHSHTSSVYWLGVPERFCKEHLPAADEKFVLEDEKEKEWECTYLAQKQGLSSGWRGFVVDHEVMDGDCCVFELAKPGRFKVHILRFEDESEEDEDKDEDDSDGKKPRSRKARKVSQSKKFVVGDDEEDEDDEDDEDDEEDEEEEFDSDICDDHVSEEEDEVDDDDSEGDYSPRLSEKEANTLVAAPSRASRVAKRKIVKEESDNSEEDSDDA